jgi:hypothetical protein
MPVPCPMNQFQMTSVVGSLLLFAVDCHSPHLGEGLAVGTGHDDLGRSLVSNRL